MNYPKGLRCVRTHEWVEMEGDIAVVGLSGYVQNELGGLVFINLPEVGDQVDAGGTFGDAESIEVVSDLSSPVTGTTTEVNEELLDVPGLINSDPYGARPIKVELAEVESDPLDIDACEALINEED